MSLPGRCSEKNTWINERRSHYTMTLLVKGARSPVSESLVIKLIFLQILHIGSLLFLEQLSPTSVSRHFRKKIPEAHYPLLPGFFSQGLLPEAAPAALVNYMHYTVAHWYLFICNYV